MVLLRVARAVVSRKRIGSAKLALVMHEIGDPPHTSRRWFLAGGAAVVLGAGAGVLAAAVQDSSPAPPPAPPDALLAAIAAERVLLADLVATTGGTPPVRRVIVQARADHAAHLAALTRLLAGFRMPSAAPSPAPPHGTPRTLAELRGREQQASVVAARNAAALDGGLATVLASIAACEATHAELLR
jgi:hypothetical protein